MTAPAEIPNWHGVHHLALVTEDMDLTVRFWHGVLGAPLVLTIATDSFRHYFFRFGAECTVAFFEYRGSHIEPFSKPAGVPSPRATQFDHLALALEDEGAVLRMRERLERHDCEVTEVVDHGVLRSIYFNDPNGIALEASWWTRDPTAEAVDMSDAVLFGDPDPVPAVVELRESGQVGWTPRTALVDDETDRVDAWRAGSPSSTR